MSAHIVCISGGKDSAATYLLALERGRPFRAVTADTGHEAPETYEWISELAARTGGPEVETVQADFSVQIARKRELVQTKWVEEGVADEIVQAALDVLYPTGIPFLDLCIWKGRFPSAKARFCTEHLKSRPMDEQVFRPALAQVEVTRWQGERREESTPRSKLPTYHRVRNPQLHSMLIYRPILDWSVDQVFALHARHGLPPNPLYLEGMSRVGCLPCVMENKRGLRMLRLRRPDVLEKLLKWERLVSAASKRGKSTFFGPNTIPALEDGRLPSAADVFDWSLTTHGGRQYDMIAAMDDAAMCSSEYGLCE